MADTIKDIVDRVEGASIKELRDVDIEEVYQQMDWLLESRPTPIDLYYRWEKQNWISQDVDFSEDAAQWKQMEGFFEGLRTELQRTMTLFFIGEQAVTDTLSPLVHAAPDEGSRIFLSTQLVDEARHAVFFSRFFDEVVGVSGGLSAALAAVRPETVSGFRVIFDNDLVEKTEAVRENPGDYGAWIEGITIYHLIVEGMLALTGQKFLLRTIRELGLFPGFYSGFTAIARDESRHVNFGVRALMEAGVKDRANLERVAGVIDSLIQTAIQIVSAPERKFAFRPEDSPPNLRISPQEVREFSLTSLTKRLKVAGLPKDWLEDLTERGRRYYQEAWDEYEDTHGEEHPWRFYENEGLTATSA